jgi:hypothetical protein
MYAWNVRKKIVQMSTNQDKICGVRQLRCRTPLLAITSSDAFCGGLRKRGKGYSEWQKKTGRFNAARFITFLA